MTTINLPAIKNQLVDRRERLQQTIKYVPDPDKLFNLLQQVDSALERIDNGTYGICDVCHDPIEDDRLMVDPLITVCLDHLNYHQQKALEQDLEFATKIQRNLLPENNTIVSGWDFSYHYDPAGPVSGDFCDFIKLNDDSVLFAIGDVSGKGISASLLMTNLHALIRSLISFSLPVNEIVQKANRLFCESTLSSQYATLVIGKAYKNGDIEICNAGHNPPILVKKGNMIPLNATGVPVGLFCQSEYDYMKFNLQKDESLFLFTDGLTEATAKDEEYGETRILNQLAKSNGYSSRNTIETILKDHRMFLNGNLKHDDVTVAVLKKI
jgi:sigma-B regulation protein RsbU (phosphoserine phosphatase)